MMNPIAIRLEEENKNEKKRKLFSSISTFLIIAGIVGALLFLGLPFLDPPPPEEGVMVAMGEPDAGNSDEAAAQSEQTDASAPQTEESDETQDYEDAPEEQPSEAPSTPVTPTPTPKPTPKPKPKVNPNFQYNPTPGTGGGGGKGDNDKPGNQGQPDGAGDDPLGKGIGKSGSGDYMMGNGRKPEKPIAASCKFSRNEVVIVKIKINRDGYVVDANCVLKYKDFNNGTTVGNPYCDCAKQAAKGVKFSAKPDAPATQEGAVRFDFKVQ